MIPPKAKSKINGRRDGEAPVGGVNASGGQFKLLISLKQLALHLGIFASTIYHWSEDYSPPRTLEERHGQKRVMFELNAAKEWAREHGYPWLEPSADDTRNPVIDYSASKKGSLQDIEKADRALQRLSDEAMHPTDDEVQRFIEAANEAFLQRVKSGKMTDKDRDRIIPMRRPDSTLFHESETGTSSKNIDSPTRRKAELDYAKWREESSRIIADMPLKKLWQLALVGLWSMRTRQGTNNAMRGRTKAPSRRKSRKRGIRRSRSPDDPGGDGHLDVAKYVRRCFSQRYAAAA